MNKRDAIEACNEISRLAKSEALDNTERLVKIDNLSDDIHDFIQDNVEEDEE